MSFSNGLRPAFLVALFFAGACAPESHQVPGLRPPIARAVFPSARYTVVDPATLTGRRLALRAFEDDSLFEKFSGLASELDSLDGFGTTAPLYVRFAASLDRGNLPSVAASTAPTASVRLIDLQASVPVAYRWHYDPETMTLFVTPNEPLKPNRRYAFVGAELRDQHGALFRAGEFVDPLPLANKRATPPSLQFRSVFTTQSIHEGLVAAIDVAAIDHTAAEFPVAVSDCGDREHVGFVGRGFLRIRDHRTENNRFPAAFDAKLPEAYGSAMTIPYRFILPKGAARAPVILVQHGLASSKMRSLSCAAADEFTKHGFAAIGIDAVWHGERGKARQTATILDNLRMFLGLWGDGHGYFGEFRVARDAFRQTVLDHVELIRLVSAMSQSLDLTGPGDAPDGLPDVADRVFYHGASMGGILGSVTLALAADLEGAVLNVPGGSLHHVILEGDLELFEVALSPILSGGELERGDIRRLLAYYQTIMERVEPLNYAGHWWRSPLPGRVPRSVLIQETIDDIIMPNVATEALARAGGLPMLLPALSAPNAMASVEVPAVGLRANLAEGVAGGMSQFKMIHVDGRLVEATHGTLGAAEPTTQAASFFRSILDGAPAVHRSYE